MDTIGAADVLPFVEADLKKIAARIIEKAKEFCTSRSVTIFFLLWDSLLISFDWSVSEQVVIS